MIIFNPGAKVIKYRSILPNNLLSWHSNLLPFQGKFNAIKITVVIQPKMAVYCCGISFITLAPGLIFTILPFVRNLRMVPIS